MSIADLKVRISGNADQFDSAMKKMQKRFDKTVRKMERTGKNLTQKVTVPIGLMAVAAGKAAIDFESAFAGVRKTVDATEGEFATLRRGILDMSKELPTSAEEIAGVAEAAGQLGIQTENILEFSKTMVMLGDTTNLTADQAATSFARIANVMQIPQDRFDEMGSTVVDLGNNFATTEAEIVEFANRIAGAGKIAGLLPDQVFAIGTAMSSVGIRAESGGTAVQKALLNMNDAVATGNSSLETFAETAGMSAEAFQTLWREDAGQAFTAFVNGLGAAGDNATTILSNVGLGSERTRAAFLSLAGAGDLINRTMETGATAWEENVALTNEAQQRYDTVASKIATLVNRVKVLAISIGDALMPMVEDAIEGIESLTKWFEDLGAEGKATALTIAAMAASAGPLALLIVKIYQVAKAIKAMNLAWMATPWGLIVAGVTAVGSAMLIGSQRIKAFEAAVTEALTGDIGTENMEELTQLIATTAEKLEDAKIKQASGVMGDYSKTVENLEKKLAALIERRDELAQLQLQKIIDEKAADGVKNASDQTQKLVTSSASAVYNLREIIRLQEEARASATPRKEDEVFTATGKKLSDMAPREREIFFENPFADFMYDAEQFGEQLQDNINKTPPLTEGMNKISGAAQVAMDIANNFTQSFGQGMTNLIVQGEKFTDVLRNVGKLLASSVIQKGLSILLTGGLSGVTGFFGSGGGLFGSILGGIFGRDIGGPAMAGQPYLIGKGPNTELFIPERSGSIVPNSKLRGMGGGSSRQVIENHLYIDGREVEIALENRGYRKSR